MRVLFVFQQRGGVLKLKCVLGAALVVGFAGRCCTGRCERLCVVFTDGRMSISGRESFGLRPLLAWVGNLRLEFQRERIKEGERRVFSGG